MAKVQYSRLGVRVKGQITPLSTGTDTVSATRKARTTTQQLEQRVRLPKILAKLYSSVDIAEGSNQEGHPPIQYTEIPTAAQTSHIERTRVRPATIAAVN